MTSSSIAAPLAALFAAAFALTSGSARADIFKCVDADGLVTFTDSPSRKFASCTLLYRDPAPAPKAAAGGASTAGAAGSASAGAPPRPRGEAAAVRANPGPDNFPRVDRSEQRERDLKARQIVERELQNEQRALEEVRRQMAAPGADRADPRFRDWQSAVARHERNINEIQRQLALMK